MPTTPALTTDCVVFNAKEAAPGQKLTNLNGAGNLVVALLCNQREARRLIKSDFHYIIPLTLRWRWRSKLYDSCVTGEDARWQNISPHRGAIRVSREGVGPYFGRRECQGPHVWHGQHRPACVRSAKARRTQQRPPASNSSSPRGSPAGIAHPISPFGAFNYRMSSLMLV